MQCDKHSVRTQFRPPWRLVTSSTPRPSPQAGARAIAKEGERRGSACLSSDRAISSAVNGSPRASPQAPIFRSAWGAVSRRTDGAAGRLSPGVVCRSMNRLVSSERLSSASSARSSTSSAMSSDTSRDVQEPHEMSALIDTQTRQLRAQLRGAMVCREAGEPALCRAL